MEIFDCYLHYISYCNLQLLLKNLPKKFEVTFFEAKAINSTAKLLIYYTSNFEGFAELLSPLKEKVDFSKISSGSHILFLNLAKKGYIPIGGNYTLLVIKNKKIISEYIINLSESFIEKINDFNISWYCEEMNGEYGKWCRPILLTISITNKGDLPNQIGYFLLSAINETLGINWTAPITSILLPYMINPGENRIIISSEFPSKRAIAPLLLPKGSYKFILEIYDWRTRKEIEYQKLIKIDN